MRYNLLYVTSQSSVVIFLCLGDILPHVADLVNFCMSPLLVSVRLCSSPQVVCGGGLPTHDGDRREDRGFHGCGGKAVNSEAAIEDGGGVGAAPERNSQPTNWDPDSAPICILEGGRATSRRI